VTQFYILLSIKRFPTAEQHFVPSLASYSSSRHSLYYTEHWFLFHPCRASLFIQPLFTFINYSLALPISFDVVVIITSKQ